MQIDWFTVVAQIVNFLILLYLLKRFLYGPIVETMDRREQEIANRLQEAEEKRSEAEQQQERYRRQRQELEQERDEKLAAVQDQVEARRSELLEEAHQEVDRKKQDWQAALQREQDAFVRELSQQVGRQAGTIARRALHDLAGVQIERRMADLFVARLKELEPAERTEIAESIQRSGQGIVIRSTYDLPQETEQRIAEALKTQVLGDKDLDARFETSPELISGIEMQVDGYQVAWTIEGYLAGLEEQIRQLVEQRSRQAREGEHGS